MLHIVASVLPPRLPDIRLADALVLFYFSLYNDGG